MNVCAVADLHGDLPAIDPCHLLLIAGDVCPTNDHSRVYQEAWLRGPFTEWLRTVPASAVIGIAGNHDFALQDYDLAAGLPWRYLCNSHTDFRGLRIWGSPFTPPFFDWAYMAQEDELARMYAGIPANTSIFLTHGPPYFACDLTDRGVHAGSKALRSAMLRRHPRTIVCGHIHEGYGQESVGKTLICNVSRMNARYEPVNEPMYFVPSY